MTANHHVTEHIAIKQVIARLTEAFTPGVPEHQIDETVARIHRTFDGSKVRDFVPLLVENAARRELRAAGTEASETPTTPPQPTLDASH